MRHRPWRPMPAPTRRGPASPMRGFLAKPRIPLRSRCALRSMPPMGRHHCALRSRPRPPAQRLPMGRRYPAGRSRAAAEPGPARSLWRLRFGPGSRWRSRFHMLEAPTTWLRACGMQDLHLYVRSRFATSRAQIILPLPGCSPTSARLVAWVRLRCFRLCVPAKVKTLRAQSRKVFGLPLSRFFLQEPRLRGQRTRVRNRLGFDEKQRVCSNAVGVACGRCGSP